MVEEKTLEKTIEESYPKDAGLWLSKISESFREYWLRNRSKLCQHQNSDFKKSAVIEKDQTRHCTSSLVTRKHSLSGELVGLSWFCYSESQGKLYCFICKLLSKTSSLKDSTTREIGLGEISDDDLRSAAKKLIEN